MAERDPCERVNLSHAIGFCFLKPDYLDIGPAFERDLGDAGLDVVHRRRIILPRRIIDYIYSDSRGEDFYPTMKHELATREVAAMVVANGQETCDGVLAAQLRLEALKRGTNGFPNLRRKYHRPEHEVDDTTFERWRIKQLAQEEQQTITIRLTQQNVFHASDGPHDGIGTLLRLREYQEFFAPPLGAYALRIIGQLDEILIRHRGDRDMSKIKRSWRVVNEMPENDPEVPIRQVYTWLLTKDRQVIIVSKDGEKWQLPGGKPDNNETALEAAVREVMEETNIDIRPYQNEIVFFGEYTIDDQETDIHPPRYRQVRSWLQLPLDANELNMSTGGECESQRPEDAVRFVRAVPETEILNYIDWLEQTDEYKALKRNKVIDRAEIIT